MIAALEGHAEVVKALLAAGANIGMTDNKRYTALGIAQQKGHNKVVDLLNMHASIINAQGQSFVINLGQSNRNSKPQPKAELEQLGQQLAKLQQPEQPVLGRGAAAIAAAINKTPAAAIGGRSAQYEVKSNDNNNKRSRHHKK